MASKELIQALAATAELCGANLSEAAARLLLQDLAPYDEAAVLVALSRVRKSGKRFSLGAIIEELDHTDGRPGVEQAWAMIPQNEDASVVWTDEMARAFGVASPLLEQGDAVAARMAFKESYSKFVAEAREQALPVRWVPSLGDDVIGRQTALIAAVRERRMALNDAMALISAYPDLQQGMLISLGVDKHLLLAAPSSEGKAKVKALLANLRMLK